MRNLFCLFIVFISLSIVRGQETKLCEDSLTEKGELGIRKIETFRVEKKGDTTTWSVKEWNEKGYLLSTIYFNSDDESPVSTEYNYNENGQLKLQIKTHSEKKFNQFIEYEYDDGCLIREKVYGSSGDTAYIEYNIDEKNKVKVKQRIKGSDTTELRYVYNNDGHLIEKIGGLYGFKEEEYYKYDNEGNLISVFDWKKEIDLSFIYDLDGNRVEILMYDDREIFQRTIYRYDSEDRMNYLKNIVDDKIFKIVKYTYNDSGEETATVFYKKHKKPDEVFFEKIERW